MSTNLEPLRSAQSRPDPTTLLRYIPTIAKDIAMMSEVERWRVYNRLKEEIYRDVCTEFVGKTGGTQEYERRVSVLLEELSL